MSPLDKEEYQARALDTASAMASLVEEARAGNRAAFEQLVDLFHEEIFRMAFYRTRSAVDSEDLTQEIFVQAFTSLSNLEKADRFRTWLLTIAVNRVRDFHRKKRVLALVSLSAQDDGFDESDAASGDRPDPLDDLLRKEFWEKIGSVLGRLSRLEREVFVLRFMDHLSIREISEVLRKSESTIKTHLYRALKKFKRESVVLQLLEEEKT